MKFSQMFELKKDRPKKKKNKKKSHSVFMGIMFIVCAYAQGALFKIVEHVYGLTETNSFFDTWVLLLLTLTFATAMLCFADHLYETKRKVAIVLIIMSIIIVFYSILFTVIELVGGA